MSIAGKNILLGLTGGIAAYKIPALVRLLRAQGANVRCVMTASAKAFITPLTLQAVSAHPVADDLLDPAAEAAMGHIELARWADLVVIAPASANTIAKLASGMADDLLSTLCLATAAPIALAPAMNQQMYQATATQRNLRQLEQDCFLLWGPASGEQACGDCGPGRMLEADELLSHICNLFTKPEPLLAGKKLVITAGPTREALDPVRYLTNHSSGKMGFALAAQAARMGADVTLISGPVRLPTPPGCQRIDVQSALDMYQAAMKAAPEADIFIGCAAVADYRPASVASQKIKKQGDEMQLKLIKNPDIVAAVAALPPGQRPFTLGFAAETTDLARHAREKLQRKQLDAIAANDVANPDLGFNSDHNALTLYWPEGELAFPAMSKDALAARLLQQLCQLLPA